MLTSIPSRITFAPGAPRKVAHFSVVPLAVITIAASRSYTPSNSITVFPGPRLSTAFCIERIGFSRVPGLESFPDGETNISVRSSFNDGNVRSLLGDSQENTAANVITKIGTILFIPAYIEKADSPQLYKE